MTFAAATLAHTPPYVWAVFAWIVWQGVAALRPRTQHLWRVMSMPCLFIAAGVLPLFWRVGGSGLLAGWAAGAAVLLPVGYRTGPRLLAVDRAAGTVTRPGSAVPLVRNVAVLVVKYLLAVAAAVRADEQAALVLAGRVVSGATAGYFLGWAVSATLQYARGRTPGT